MFNPNLSFQLTAAQVSTPQLLRYHLRTASKYLRQKVASVLQRFTELASEAVHIKLNRKRDYTRALLRIIDALKKAMPGTYVQNCRVHNPLWPFDLPLSALLSGMLTHGGDW